MRYAVALLLLLLTAWPAQAAIAVVQTVSCEASGASTCTTTGVTTTTGNLFVASSSYCCSVTPTISDSKSNSYTESIADNADPVSGTGIVRQDYTSAGTGGALHTFTITGGAGLYATLSVSEISGAAASPLDKTAIGGDVFATSHATNTTATTTQSNELLIGVGGSVDIGATFVTDSGAGWTEQTNAPTDIDSEGIITGTKVVSTAGSYAYTFTTTANARSSQGISTWKESATGSGTPSRMLRGIGR